jgi:hypothetical protein
MAALRRFICKLDSYGRSEFVMSYNSDIGLNRTKKEKLLITTSVGQKGGSAHGQPQDQLYVSIG